MHNHINFKAYRRQLGFKGFLNLLHKSESFQVLLALAFVPKHKVETTYTPESPWAENLRRIYCGHISLKIYVPTMSTQHLPHETYILHEMLCGHSSDFVRILCRHISPGIYVSTISFFGFHLWRSGTSRREIGQRMVTMLMTLSNS